MTDRNGGSDKRVALLRIRVSWVSIYSQLASPAKAGVQRKMRRVATLFIYNELLRSTC